MRKLSVSVPSMVVEDMDYITGRMKISRSALISNLINSPVHDMRVLLESIPDNPSPEDIIRSRGASADLVKKRLTEINQLVDGDDLFSE